MTWLGVELPPDENGFHKLDGKYRAIFTGLHAVPDALLKSFFCNCKTDWTLVDAPVWSTICHARICVVYARPWRAKNWATNMQGYLNASDPVIIVAIALYSDKIGIPCWLSIYLCIWNFIIYPVWGTWRLPPGMCSNYWNTSGTSELQSLQFYTFSVALDCH